MCLQRYCQQPHRSLCTPPATMRRCWTSASLWRRRACFALDIHGCSWPGWGSCTDARSRTCRARRLVWVCGSVCSPSRIQCDRSPYTIRWAHFQLCSRARNRKNRTQRRRSPLGTPLPTRALLQDPRSSYPRLTLQRFPLRDATNTCTDGCGSGPSFIIFCHNEFLFLENSVLTLPYAARVVSSERIVQFKLSTVKFGTRLLCESTVDSP